ncbi:terminase small subunit [Inquilinus sp. CAU 1745]|uniref:terminase small subunit n=1 Tax=Inquilinus sp. CAU 1745 TaxID=3140369 RepID=UPI00325B47BE
MAHTASPIPDMPPRQEAFCRSVAHGASAASAARAAGYSVDNARGQAARLLAKPYIRRRIEDLRDGLLEARNREVADLVAIARETLDKAREEGKFGLALRAVELIAKLNGHFARQLPEIAHAALQPTDGLLDAEEDEDDDGGDDGGDGGEGPIRFLSDEPDEKGRYPEDDRAMSDPVAIPAAPLLADGVAWDGLGRHPWEEDPIYLGLAPDDQNCLLSNQHLWARARAAARRTGHAHLIERPDRTTYREPGPGRRRAAAGGHLAL